MSTVTAVVCHYGDNFWVENLLHYLTEQSQIKEIHLGHHYSTEEVKSALTTNIDHLSSSVVTIHNRVASITDIAHPSIRHAVMLNQILKSLNHSNSQYILILDSDIIPMKSNWLDNVLEVLKTHDVLISVSHMYEHASHPCLIAFRSTHLEEVVIEAKASKVWTDGKFREFRLETASNLAQTLIDKNLRVALVRPQTKYKSNWFHYYLNRTLVHVGNQSFYSKSRLRAPGKGIKFKYSLLLKYELPKYLAKQLRKGNSPQNWPLAILKSRVIIFEIIKMLLKKGRNISQIT